MKVVHRAQRGWGVGVVVQVAEEGRRLAVRFAGREGVTVVSGRDPALVEVPPDTPLEQRGRRPARRARRRRRRPGRARSRSAPAWSGSRRSAAPTRSARSSPRASTCSRTRWAPRGASSPIACRASSSPTRSGLGKTVEAGLVFAGLRQLGIAERVLVVVPEHLAFQWLAELFHKFNALFTLLTPERIAALGGPEAALARSPHAIVSPRGARATTRSSPPPRRRCPLDLVVVDEAHHLADDALHDAVAPDLPAPPSASSSSPPRRCGSIRASTSASSRSSSRCPSTSLEEFLARLEQHEAYADGGPRPPRRRLGRGRARAAARALPGRRLLLARRAAAAPRSRCSRTSPTATASPRGSSATAA